jgi:hypothetical protein
MTGLTRLFSSKAFAAILEVKLKLEVTNLASPRSACADRYGLR